MEGIENRLGLTLQLNDPQPDMGYEGPAPLMRYMDREEVIAEVWRIDGDDNHVKLITFDHGLPFHVTLTTLQFCKLAAAFQQTVLYL